MERQRAHEQARRGFAEAEAPVTDGKALRGEVEELRDAGPGLVERRSREAGSEVGVDGRS